MEPARFPVHGITKLAVGEFEADCTRCSRLGEMLADEVTVRLQGKGFYEIIPGKPVVGERETTGGARMSELRAWGREHGVNGILGGTIRDVDVDRTWTTRQVTEKEHTGRYHTRVYVEDGQVKKHQEEIIRDVVKYIPMVQVNVRVEAAAGLYDLTSGERLEVHEYRERDSRYLEGEFHVRDVIDADAMVDRLIRRIAGKIVDDLVPHQVSEKLKLASDKDCAAGMKLARQGDWEGARRAWSAVVQADPRNHAAFYNLGIAAEVSGDYDAARVNYEHALSINEKDLYRAALYRVRNRMLEQDELKRQMRDR